MESSGFPRGTRYTPVPDPLFGPLLEAISDPAELKCTLRALWVLHQKKARPRTFTEEELLSDRVLLVGLKGLGGSPYEAISRGLKAAVDRGTFLTCPMVQNNVQTQVYTLNDEAGRRAFEAMRQDGRPVDGSDVREGVVGAIPEPKPNIFNLYENRIGVLTPTIAEEMKEAEAEYPWSWIQEAFDLAIDRNRRSWPYIQGILRRWSTEGISRRRSAEGKDNGEPGRYPPKVSLKEYIRRKGNWSGGT